MSGSNRAQREQANYARLWPAKAVEDVDGARMLLPSSLLAAIAALVR